MGDLSTTTLVAIMFVMIVSMAIANVLGSLVHIVNRLMDRSADWTYTSWMVLLLLLCLKQRRAHYVAASPRFFLLLAISQVWILVLDVVWEGGLTASGFPILAAVGLLSVMANARSVRAHAIGSAAAWVLFVGTAALETSGVIP